MRHLHTGQMSEQRALGVKRPLWFAGRPRRVDDQRRIVGARTHGLELVGAPAQALMERCTAFRRAIDAVDALQLGQLCAQAGYFRSSIGIGNEQLRARVGEPELQRVDTEQREQGNDDGTGLVGCDVRYRRLRRLGQKNCNPVAFPDARLLASGSPPGSTAA